MLDWWKPELFWSSRMEGVHSLKKLPGFIPPFSPFLPPPSPHPPFSLLLPPPHLLLSSSFPPSSYWLNKNMLTAWLLWTGQTVKAKLKLSKLNLSSSNLLDSPPHCPFLPLLSFLLLFLYPLGDSKNISSIHPYFIGITTVGVVKRTYKTDPRVMASLHPLSVIYMG